MVAASNKMTSKSKVIAIVVVVLGFSGLAFWHWNFGVVFSDETLIKLNSGISTNELVKILGQPSFVWKDEWHYHRFTFTVGVVIIDENGRVKSAMNH